jgi:ATP-dependent helicase HrpB
VLSAPPGSGKTTRVPLALLDEPWLGGQEILMLEPRRPAARMAAARMAHLLGEAVGATVGYQVRFERRIGAHTRVQVLTEGILTRRIQGDPELTGVGLLIFDELHERSLQADLGLALALDAVGALRPDLRILAMSATLDTTAVSRLLADAPVIEGEGRPHPVAIRYAERTPDQDPAQAMTAGVRRALLETDGDVLAFLAGAGEIERTRTRLAPMVGDQVLLLPLHGALPAHEQERALAPNPGPRRRVVLATDIAETSLTIEGVTTVVDSGVTRKPRFDPDSGLTRLVTEPISLASAAQRAGRAGRLGPGTCYRLWTLAQEVGRPEHRPAEILQADLAPLALELALWGVKDPAAMAWLDPPPTHVWSQAVGLLRILDALDEQGAITRLGRLMATLPIHPRLARMLAAANASASARLTAADLAALLSERDPWVTRPGEPRSADLELRLQALDAFRAGRPVEGFDRRRLAAADRVSRQLLRAMDRSPEKVAEPADEPLSRSRVGDKAGEIGAIPRPGALLAVAYPDRVARRRAGGEGRYLLAAGSGVVLPPDDPLGAREWLVVADLDAAGRDARARLALPICEPELRSVLGGHIETVEAVAWEDARDRVTGRREERLGALVLSAALQPITAPGRAATILREQVGRRYDQVLDWTEDARQLQARVALLRNLEPEAGWPDLSDDWLRTHLDDWLGPWLDGLHSIAEVRALDIAAVLRGRLEWTLQQRLDREAPAALVTPAGTRRRLDYAGGEPVLAVALQEMLGAARTPVVCGGRIPVTLHLLSPARRPIQITRDLAGFWAGSYAEVRKEMRGRYPKHHWPDDPASARPMARSVKRR